MKSDCLRFLMCAILSGAQITVGATPKPSKETVDQRIQKSISWYNYSKKLYQEKGPWAFWESFAFLATSDELKSLMKVSRGYPTLPEIVQESHHSLLIKNADDQYRIVVKNFDQQIVDFNGQEFKVSAETSLLELVDLLTMNLEYNSSQSQRDFLFFIKSLAQIVGLQSAELHASSVALYAAIGAVAGVLLSAIFGNQQNKQHSPSFSNAQPPVNHDLAPSPSPEAGASGAPSARAPIPTPPSSPSPSPKTPLPSHLGNPLKNVSLGKCNIVFVRHAHRVAGKEEITQKGQMQIKNLTTFLNHSTQAGAVFAAGFDHIYHSPAPRAKNTIQLFATQGENASKFKEMKALDECCYKGDTKKTKNPENAKTELMKACRSGTDAKPVNILAASHGITGGKLLKLLTGKSVSVHHADPYVLTPAPEGSAYPFVLNGTEKLQPKTSSLGDLQTTKNQPP